MLSEVADYSDEIPAYRISPSEYRLTASCYLETVKRHRQNFVLHRKKERIETILNKWKIWFDINIFSMLHINKDFKFDLKKIFEGIDGYFYSGKRIGVVHTFTYGETRDQFTTETFFYFIFLNRTLISILKRNGFNRWQAERDAREIIYGIKRALILARSQDNPEVFAQTLRQLQHRVIADYGEKMNC
jgi:hypothetical protein